MKSVILLIAIISTSFSSIQAQTVAQLQAQINTLKAQVAALLPLKALAPYVAVDLNPEYGVRGPHVIFHDCNVHVTNGTFKTAQGNGLGNLFIGYDYIDTSVLGAPSWERGGSHNLIIGDQHLFHTACTASIISGRFLEVDNANSAAIGGIGNRVWNVNAVAIGGADNTVASAQAVDIGGASNWIINNDYAVLVGGHHGGTTAPYAGLFGAIIP
jgi:hypothetical protein